MRQFSHPCNMTLPSIGGMSTTVRLRSYKYSAETFPSSSDPPETKSTKHAFKSDTTSAFDSAEDGGKSAVVRYRGQEEVSFMAEEGTGGARERGGVVGRVEAGAEGVGMLLTGARFLKLNFAFGFASLDAAATDSVRPLSSCAYSVSGDTERRPGPPTHCLASPQLEKWNPLGPFCELAGKGLGGGGERRDGRRIKAWRGEVGLQSCEEGAIKRWVPCTVGRSYL